MTEETYEPTKDYTERQIHNFIIGGALIGTGTGWIACTIFVGDRLSGVVALVLVLAFLLYREWWSRR